MADEKLRLLWRTADFISPAVDITGESPSYTLVTTDDRIKTPLLARNVGLFVDWNNSTAGRFSLPSTEQSMWLRYEFPADVEIDCCYLLGIVNADLEFYGSDNGTNWTQLVPEQANPRIRQQDHWTERLAHTFVTFSSVQSYRYYRFDFSAISGLRLFGNVSLILAGRHHEFGGNYTVGSTQWHVGGQSAGGLYSEEDKESAAFRSQDFDLEFAQDSDVKEMAACFWHRANGDPIALQYAPNRSPEFNTIYGVLATRMGADPKPEDQDRLRFKVNETSPSRSLGLLRDY